MCKYYKHTTLRVNYNKGLYNVQSLIIYLMQAIEYPAEQSAMHKIF